MTLFGEVELIRPRVTMIPRQLHSISSDMVLHFRSPDPTTIAYEPQPVVARDGWLDSPLLKTERDKLRHKFRAQRAVFY